MYRLWDDGGSFHGYLSCVFLHSLEVEIGGVDQVVSIDDGYQLPFYTVSLTASEHIPHLVVLTHTHTDTDTFIYTCVLFRTFYLHTA